MMRVDPQDHKDAEYLVRQDDFDSSVMRPPLDRAVVPPVPEIDEAFKMNRTWLAKLLK